MSYSSEMLKRAAFQDELTNVLNTVAVESQDEEWIVVRDYITRRIKEIDAKYK